MVYIIIIIIIIIILFFGGGYSFDSPHFSERASLSGM